jgi:hypothetical protein
VVAYFLQDRLRPFHRNTVAGDGDPNFHARRHVFAQHFLDPAQRTALRAGLFDQFGDDDLTGAGLAAAIGRHDDVLIDPLVVGNDEIGAAFLAKASHHGFGVAFQHLDHRTLAATSVIHSDHPRHRPVAVQQFPHLPGREEQAVPAFVGNQKTVTFGMTDHPAGHQIHLGDQTVTLATVADQLPVPFHRPQPAG